MNAAALVLTRPLALQRRTLALPEVRDDTALLRIEACGLCGTDHEQFSGLIPADFAFIPGHEIVGVIDRIGEKASARWGVTNGQRVAVEVFRSCRECVQCRSGEYKRCVKNGLATMFGFVDADIGSGLWGGYATHLELPADAMLLPIPDGMDPVTATLFNPLGAGIKWAATLPGTAEGAVVAVLGPGIRGIASAVAAKEAGASLVVMTGLGARDEARLNQARSFGVDVIVDAAHQDPVDALLRATGGRLADVVVDVTAKAPAAIADAVNLAAHGATVVIAGTRGIGGGPGIEPDLVVYKELQIIGALGVDYPAYQQAITLLTSGRWPFDQISRHTAGFDELPALLQTLASPDAGAPPALHNVFIPTA